MVLDLTVRETTNEAVRRGSGDVRDGRRPESVVFGFVEEKARVLVWKWLPLVIITGTETCAGELCGDIHCLVEEGAVFMEGALADKRDWHKRDQDWKRGLRVNFFL